MTQNDNIRYYTGTLEPVEDIDVVFKHIYDLMLANGGEDSGLNAVRFAENQEKIQLQIQQMIMGNFPHLNLGMMKKCFIIIIFIWIIL